MNYKTSKTDFEYFKKQFARWSSLLGVKSWEIDFTHGNREGDVRNYRAQVVDVPYNRLAIIYFETLWDHRPLKKEISMVAFHEACELLFSELTLMFDERKFDELQRELEVHKIIRLLENILFEKYWAKN